MMAHQPRLFRAAATLVVLVMACQGKGQSEQQPSMDSLISAIEKWDHKAIHEILVKGIDLNTLDSTGRTALIESIDANFPVLPKELVASGADPNFKDYTGGTPLMHAAWNCKLELARFLLGHGARVDAKDRDGETALTMAAWTCKDGRMVRLLLEAGAAVNDKTKIGNTALMNAAFNGDLQAVKTLVGAGADLDATNNEGETALTFAQKYGPGEKKAHNQIYVFLQQASKKATSPPR